MPEVLSKSTLYLTLATVCGLGIMSDATKEKQLYNHYVLKKHDPCLDKIIYTSNIGEVYEFNNSTEAWEQMQCKGTVFLYSRISNDQYPYAILVLNRENTKDFFLGITPAQQAAARGVLPMETDLQENTVMIQVNETRVYGIWLFEENDRNNFVSLTRWCISNGQA